jgi:hypothetical protein
MINLYSHYPPRGNVAQAKQETKRLCAVYEKEQLTPNSNASACDKLHNQNKTQKTNQTTKHNQQNNI